MKRLESAAFLAKLSEALFRIQDQRGKSVLLVQVAVGFTCRTFHIMSFRQTILISSLQIWQPWCRLVWCIKLCIQL